MSSDTFVVVFVAFLLLLALLIGGLLWYAKRR